MRQTGRVLLAGLVMGGIMAPIGPAGAAALKLSLPLGRTAYETNETIDLAVVRSDAGALPAGSLTLAVQGTDGSAMSFVIPVRAVAAGATGAATTEHLHLNGWLMRPGHYTLTVNSDGATANTDIDLYSYLPRSTFKNIDWGSRVQGPDMAILGEDSMGFNLIFGEYRLANNLANSQATMRGGAQYMQVVTMSGGHQMDLRPEADWSDPLVIKGGTARVAQQAFFDRTKPNALGVQFYDEPGLTWENGSPNSVTPQLHSFKNAFGVDRIADTAVKPNDPASVAQWQFWGRWKESFMEAAWKDARFGVEQVDPTFLSATQSQYAWNAYTDGYYFNVVRSLPVISGHGGYDDGPGSYFYPAYFQEFGRMRDADKPNWYLPQWGNTTHDELYRLEQYLTFMNGVQGLDKPPDPSMNDPYSAVTAHSIVEANKVGLRLGTIFDTMKPAANDVAVLYSLSQDLDAQIKSGMQDNYLGGGQGRGRLLSMYFASKMIHIPFTPVVEEDVLDGTVAANHKAIVLTNINYLDPKVTAVLEDYAAKGGVVLMTDDCQAVIKGATKVGVSAVDQDADLEKIWAAGNHPESIRLRAAGLYFKAAKPLADALKAKLAAAGIRPIVDCDNDEVVTSRQAQGDIGYIFAVNATWDPQEGTPWSIKATTANIGFPGTGGAIYDAVRGGPVAEFTGQATHAPFHFGAGEMRVFAHTARPIGGVQVSTPVVTRDFTLDKTPISVLIDATLVDATNVKLAGAAPMQVRVIDPLGGVRYDLYRATDMGDLKLSLPLAANDPAGVWTITVKELLDNHVGTARFNYTPAAQCGALAGATTRAVYFGNDRENIFRFFRNHQDVTIVTGTSDYDTAAATRLTESLKPWNVRCTIVNAADVNKPRTLTAEEAKTWVGIEFGDAKPGDANTPAKVGFAVQGPVILVGNPADNPLIQSVSAMGFLPYTPTADFPGQGRGYIAWQRDAVGVGQESVSVIATDATGMSEAVGSLYEATAGLDPMTRWTLPDASTVTPAARNLQAPEAPTVWHAVTPDRVVSLSIAPSGAITALSMDGSQTTISAAGKVVSQKPVSDTEVAAANKATAGKPVVPAALTAKLVPYRIPKFVATNNGETAIAYWGGTLQVFGADGTLQSQQLQPQDISALAWHGNTVLVGQSDGTVDAIAAK